MEIININEYHDSTTREYHHQCQLQQQQQQQQDEERFRWNQTHLKTVFFKTTHLLKNNSYLIYEYPQISTSLPFHLSSILKFR